jgi:hypothetical protein
VTLEAVAGLYQTIVVGPECYVEHHEVPSSHAVWLGQESCTLSTPLEAAATMYQLGNISHFWR